jgi:putrescine transport system permease protein
MAIVMFYSFNASPYVMIWGGASLKWYETLLEDSELMNALITSLKIATSSATLGTVLGVCAGLGLARLGAFKGRTLFIGMLSAPFIIPEVVTGFSLLLLFVMAGQVFGLFQDRGALTVILAHSTVGISYVAVIIASRLSMFDESLEEAAMDLGAHPLKVFFVITLPIIAHSLVVGWLLSFTLSLDDVVIASFTSGAGTTTLPMLIYSRIKFGMSPQINALASLMIGVVSMVIFAICIITLRKPIAFKQKD